MAGREGRHGTFTLDLNDVDSIKAYSGSFVESPGITYSMYGNQSAVEVLDPQLCYQCDNSLLESTTSFDFTGVWVKPVGSGIRDLYVEGGNVASSYFYGATQAPGYNYGPVSTNGQVFSSNWYESAAYEGMYLFVAKNDSAFYSLW
jgi:hypothetical protein